VQAEAELAFGRVLVPQDLDRAAIAPREGAAHGRVEIEPAPSSA
jgi:hypothetical protein